MQQLKAEDALHLDIIQSLRLIPSNKYRLSNKSSIPSHLFYRKNGISEKWYRGHNQLRPGDYPLFLFMRFNKFAAFELFGYHIHVKPSHANAADSCKK